MGLLALIAAVLISSAFVQSQASQEAFTCEQPPVAPCFRHHGRLSTQNGIAIKLWLIGTTRMVGVGRINLPHVANRYLEMTSSDHSYIYGDFEVCPLEHDRPGKLRRVCVTRAENLVVQKFVDPSRPFRLLSTW